MQYKKWTRVALFATSLFVALPAQSEQVVIQKVIGDREHFISEILALALSKSDPQATIVEHEEEFPQSRRIESIKLGQIDLMWAGVDETLESELLPVRIPILKGMLGHRIFIIKQEDQGRFNNIRSLSDLKQFKAGQGTLWGDTQVLKSANIPVVTTLKYNNLFRMLEGGRFDYFPRALHEPWTEVQSRADLNLVVEKNIMLVYPFAMYFFVDKNNQALHDKLYRGFEMAIADGSFDQLFFNNKNIKDALTTTDVKNRTVIKFDNPAMHPDTPIDRKAFWLDPANL